MTLLRSLVSGEDTGSLQGKLPASVHTSRRTVADTSRELTSCGLRHSHQSSSVKESLCCQLLLVILDGCCYGSMHFTAGLQRSVIIGKAEAAPAVNQCTDTCHQHVTPGGHKLGGISDKGHNPSCQWTMPSDALVSSSMLMHSSSSIRQLPKLLHSQKASMIMNSERPDLLYRWDSMACKQSRVKKPTSRWTILQRATPIGVTFQSL